MFDTASTAIAMLRSAEINEMWIDSQHKANALRFSIRESIAMYSVYQNSPDLRLIEPQGRPVPLTDNGKPLVEIFG